jgi:hypothetical protein
MHERLSWSRRNPLSIGEQVADQKRVCVVAMAPIRWSRPPFEQRRSAQPNVLKALDMLCGRPSAQAESFGEFWRVVEVLTNLRP